MSIFGGIGSVVGADIIAYVKLSGADTFNRDLDKLNANAASMAKTMNAGLTAAMVAGAAAFAISTLEAAKFEKQMALVNTLLPYTSTSFGSLNDEVLKLAQGSNASIPSLTKGLYDLISSGATAENSIGALTLATQAAAAGMTSTDVAIRAGMATVNAYGLSMNELNRIYDLQFQTVNIGVISYEELGNSIGTVLPAAASLGVSLEDVYGAIAQITKSGIDAQSTTTYLAQAFNSMIQNSDKWKELGANIYDVNGNFSGLVPIITALNEKMAGLSDEQQQVIFSSLDMDVRAGRAVLAMVNNFEMFTDTMGSVSNSAGAMEAAFAKATDTLDYQAGVLKNQLTVAFIEMGNNVLPILKAMTSAFTEHPEAIKAIISIVAELAIGLGSLAALYKTIEGLQVLWGTSFGPIGLAITAAVAGYIAMKAAIEGMNAAQLDQISSIDDNIFKLGTLESRYNSLMATENLSKEQQDILKRTVDELKVVYGDLGVKILETDTNFGKLTESIKQQKLTELKEKAAELETQLATMNSKIETAGMQATSWGGNVTNVSMATGVWVEEKKQLNAQLAVTNETIANLSAKTVEHTERVTTNKAAVVALTDAQNKHANQLANVALLSVEYLSAMNAVNTAISAGKNAVDLGTQSFIGLNAETVNAKNHSIGLSTATTVLNGNIQTLGDKTTTAKTATDSANTSWTEYSQLIHEITGRMGAVGNAINVVVDAIVSGGNPLITALNIASIAFNALSANSESFDWTAYKEEIFGASSAVLDVTENLRALNDEFGQYDLIDGYKVRLAALDALLLYLTVTNRENTAAWREAKAEYGMVSEAIRELTEAFKFLDQDLLAQSTYLTENIFDAWEYYGGVIPTEKMKAWLALLEENTAKLEAERASLAVGSQAWIDNEAAINANKFTIGLLNGTYDSLTEYISLAGLNFNQASAFLQQMGYSASDAAEKLAAMGMHAPEMSVAVGQIGAASNSARLNVDGLRVAAENLDNTDVSVPISANTALANAAMANLKNSLQTLVNTGYTVPVNIVASGELSYHQGGMLYHSGGLVAHNGMMLGQYGTLREVPFTGLEGEYVLNPNIGRKFGEAALDAFNVSGNPAVLGAESRQAQPTVELKPEFTIMNAAPETFVTWTDKYIHPRIRDNDDRQIKSDRFK